MYIANPNMEVEHGHWPKILFKNWKFAKENRKKDDRNKIIDKMSNLEIRQKNKNKWYSGRNKKNWNGNRPDM